MHSCRCQYSSKCNLKLFKLSLVLKFNHKLMNRSTHPCSLSCICENKILELFQRPHRLEEVLSSALLFSIPSPNWSGDFSLPETMPDARSPAPNSLFTRRPYLPENQRKNRNQVAKHPFIKDKVEN